MDRQKLFEEQINKSEDFKQHSKNFYHFNTDKDFVDLQKYMWSLYYLVPTKDNELFLCADKNANLLLVFTDMFEFEKWNNNQGFGYNILDYDELHILLNDLNASASFNCMFSDDSEFRLSAIDLKNLYKIRLLSNTTDAEYIIGTPSVFPQELVDALIKEFTNDLLGVDNCYLSQCAIVNETSASTNYVFVVDSASKVYLYIEEICSTIAKRINCKYPVIFVHASSDMGHMILQTKPQAFYTAKKTK